MSDARCGWCRGELGDGKRYCSKMCRQSAWRLRGRRASSLGPGTTAGARFAYADPPYPGLASYYKGHPDFAGEVDHAELIARLAAASDAGELAGWALSTSSEALRSILPMCPEGARVCSWVKPIGVSSSTYGLHSTWEPLIVVGGRPCRPGIRDWLRAMPARGGGSDLIGRKPLAFCAFLFDALGMVPGDELEDLFPGSGIVAQAWASLTAAATRVAPASLTAGGQRLLFASLLQEETRVVDHVASRLEERREGER